MNLPGLNIDLMMEVARLAKDVAAAKGLLQGFRSDVDRIVSTIKVSLASIGAGLSVAGLIALGKHTTDSIAKFKDLGIEAGTTASAMSRFEEPTRKAGLQLEAVSTSMVRLGKAALEARDPQSKAAQALNSIGLSAERFKNLKPDEMFELVARSLAKYSDGISKNNVMQELFNRSGKDMAKLIAEIADAGKLHATVTDEEAEAADRFNDQMVELKMNSEKGWRSIVSEGLPAMNAIVKAFIDGKREAGLLLAAVRGLSEFFSQAFGTGDGGTAERLAAVNKEILEAEKIAKRIESMRSSALTGWMVSDQGAVENQQRLNQLYAQRNQLQRELFQDELAAQNKRATAPKGSGDPRYDPEAAKRLKEAIENSKKYADASEHVNQWIEHNIKLAKLANAEAEKAMELDERQIKAKEDAARSFRENVEQLEFEVKMLGKSNEQRQIAIALRELEKAGLPTNTAAVAEYVERIRAAVVAIDDYRSKSEMLREQVALWNEISDVASAFFVDLVTHGKSAFDNLRRWVKQLLADMVALFAKRWILNLAAGGSVMGSAGNALAGGIGSDSIAGAGLSFVGSAAGTMILGTAGAGAMGATAGGAFAQGMMGVGTGVWAPGSAGAMGASLSGVYSALAAIPVWGWIAMAVIAIGAWIAGNHKGGDKVGGSFFQGGAVPGTDNGRFFTPSQGDEGLRTIVEATSRGYQDAVLRLGGTAGGFNFGLGFDHDPAGTQQSRVSSMLTDAQGNIVYRRDNAGMDDKEVEGALALETQRMLVRALQQTDLHDAIDALFDPFDVTTATGEQLQAILAQAMELKSAIDVLALWNVEGLDIEALKAMNREGETLTQTLNALAQAQQNYYSLFFTEEEQLARKTEELGRAFEMMGLDIPTTRQGFRDMVDEALRLSNGPLYRWLMEISGAVSDILPPLEDLDEGLNDIADTVTATTQLFAAAVGQIVSGVNDPLTLYAQGGPARQGIANHLNSLLTGNNSPLDPMGRFRAAESDYSSVLSLAQSGDINAMMRLPAVHQTMLDIARSIWGSSSPFVSLFERTFNEVAAVGEVASYNERMLKNSSDSLQYQAEHVEIARETRDLLRTIAQKSAPKTADSWSAR